MILKICDHFHLGDDYKNITIVLRAVFGRRH